MRVLTNMMRVYSNFQDPLPNLFCAINQNPRRERFQLARPLQKQPGGHIATLRRESGLLGTPLFDAD